MTNDFGVSSAARRLPRFCRAGLVVGALLAPNAALAFTLEGGSSDQWAPKFDLEEQARQFSTPGTAGSTGGTEGIETPLGTMHFGVQRVTPGYGSPFSPSFNSQVRAEEDRRHVDRMLTPIPSPDNAR